jgi:hypothetical protein
MVRKKKISLNSAMIFIVFRKLHLLKRKQPPTSRPILNKKTSLCKCVLQCGEDIAFYLEKSKGCNYLLGIGREGNAPLNASKLDFNEDVRLLGVENLCHIALELMKLHHNYFLSELKVEWTW